MTSIVSKKQKLGRLALTTAALSLIVFPMTTLFPSQALAANFTSSAGDGGLVNPGSDDTRTGVGPIVGENGGAGTVIIKGGIADFSGAGRGGNVNYSGITTIDSEVAIVISSGAGGAVAAGGNVTVSTSGNVKSDVDILIENGEAGANGKSGDVSLTITGGNLVAANSLVIGNTSAVHNGADAGMITVAVNGNIEVGDAFTIIGANGGAATSAERGKIAVAAKNIMAKNGLSITAGNGGAAKGGGSVEVKANEINLYNNLAMSGGAFAGGGSGGSASLTADAVNLRSDSTWTLDRYNAGGDLTVSVGSLNVEAGKTFTLATTTSGTTNYFSADKVHFQKINLARGATFDNRVSPYGATIFEKKDYFVGQLNIDHHATLAGGGVFAPGASGSKITLNGIDLDNLASRGGQAALTLGANTYLSLQNATEDTVKVNLNPQAVKALYEAIQGGDKLLLIRGGGGLADIASGYEITARGTQGLTTYVFKFGLGINEIASLPGAEGAQILAESNASNSYYAPYSDASATGLWTALQGQRALDKNIGDLAGNLEPGQDGAGLALTGGHYRNETGSHVDMDTYSVNLATGHQRDTWAGLITYGYFAEAGQGNYDTYNQLQSLGNIKGDGQTSYLGGGFFATTLWGGGAYLEITGRGGVVSNDYNIEDRSGAAFDTVNAYWGAHLGFGRRWDIIENGQMDLYGKVFWTHLANDYFQTVAGEQVELDRVNSIRSRVGGRYTHRWENGAQVYGGLAWEHEYDGQSKGQVNHQHIDKTAKLEGSSALLETGLSLKPFGDDFTIDVGLFGAIGQEQGFGGTVGLKVVF